MRSVLNDHGLSKNILQRCQLDIGIIINKTLVLSICTHKHIYLQKYLQQY